MTTLHEPRRAPDSTPDAADSDTAEFDTNREITSHTEAALDAFADKTTSATPALPTRIVIEASNSRVGVNWRELWQFRELLGFLTWRDLKVRYKQTALGVLWAIMQPLFTMLIFNAFLGRVSTVAVVSVGIPQGIAIYAALVPWTFFANAVTTSGNSLVGSAHLISKVYFPRLLVPSAAIIAALLDFLIAAVFLLPLLAVYRYFPPIGWHTLMLLPLSVLMAFLALGAGLWMSALNVKYRDIRYALPFIMQLGLFATPIFYARQDMPAKWQNLLLLNPMTGVIENFRAALFGLPFQWLSLGISCVLAALMMVYALWVFRNMEKSFADII